VNSDDHLDAQDRRAQLNEAARRVRPELHRYAARMMVSVVEGEEVVQDTFALALSSPQDLPDETALRAWLFRIAHNRAIDLLRRRALVKFENLESAAEVAEETSISPEDSLMRQETVQLAISRFSTLTVEQRSAVVLKDVLGESITNIGRLINLSSDSVKAHLARGRARLRDAMLEPERPQKISRVFSDEVRKFATLFNAQDWDGLRTMLASDVKLNQATHPLRRGAADVGTFFSIYSELPKVHLRPAWLEGREVLAVLEVGVGERPCYFMAVEWTGGKITSIRDYRYVRYIIENAAIELPP
jgi:RNA polymerase sigma factor (sigma-70 family)